MVCLFCEVKYKTPSNVRSLGNYNLAIGSQKLYCEQAKKIFPTLQERAIKIPESKFFDKFGQCKDCPDPDLEADESLQACRMTIRNRQTAEDEDDIAMKFLNWATNSNSQPSLILSSFAFSKYLKTQGSIEVYRDLESKGLLGETDIIVLTKKRGVFVAEVKSTFETNPRILDDIKKAWEQAQKSAFVFKALNSDIKSISRVTVHKMVAFPNISYEFIRKHLCKNHQTICICKESLSSQENFQSDIKKFLDSKGLGDDFTATSFNNQDYRTLTSRYAMICRDKDSPVEQCEIARKTASKIEKVGEKMLTKDQKAILDQFSLKNKQGMKFLLNGHYGSGKTIILQHGFKKLYNMIEGSSEKHVMIFSSLASVKGSDGQICNPNSKADDDKFLRHVKDSLSEYQDKNENIKIIIGHFQEDVMAKFGMSSLCKECSSKNLNKCKHDIKKMFRVSDILRVAHAANKKFLNSKSKGNVHFFLDEVRNFDQDWQFLTTDDIMDSNVIWMALRPEHFNDNTVKFRIENFEIKTLEHNLRNSRQIFNLTNELRRYLLSFWPICKFTTSWTKSNKYIYKEIPVKYNQKFDATPYSLPKYWHHVSGTQPQLIILNDCTCLSKRDSIRNCKCYNARIEAALKQSIVKMFGLDAKLSLSEISEKLPATIFISLHITTKENVIDHSLKHVLEKEKVPHVIDTAEGEEKLNLFGKIYGNCRIRLIDSSTVLGNEFDNLIYIIDHLYHSCRINPVTKDILGNYLLDNCSRARSQLHIITPGGKEMNKIRLRFNPEDWWNIFYKHNALNESAQWAVYGYEVIDAFLLVHLLNNGCLLFLPQSDQLSMGQKEAINLLREGRDLEKNLKRFNRKGEEINKIDKCSFPALEVFSKGLQTLQRRLTGDCPGSRFDPLDNLGANSKVISYLKKIKFQELKLLYNCGKALQKIDLDDYGTAACMILNFLVEDIMQYQKRYTANDDRTKSLLKDVLSHLEQHKSRAAGKKELESLKDNMKKQLNSQIEQNPDGWIVDYDSAILLTLRKQIINTLIIPISSQVNRLILDHETGLEYGEDI